MRPGPPTAPGQTCTTDRLASTRRSPSGSSGFCRACRSRTSARDGSCSARRERAERSSTTSAAASSSRSSPAMRHFHHRASSVRRLARAPLEQSIPCRPRSCTRVKERSRTSTCAVFGDGFGVDWMRDSRYGATIAGRFRVDGRGFDKTHHAAHRRADGSRMRTPSAGSLANADVSMSIHDGTLTASYSGDFSKLDPAVPLADQRCRHRSTGTAPSP